jgi:sporulation protein YlmC with PRC-barrel domain
MKNFNKDNESGKNHEGVNPNMPLKYLTVSSIIGDNVINTKGEHMGAIHDIMIKLSTGMIEYFVIEMGGFLGIGEKFFAFPYRLLIVDSVSETFVLDQELDTLKNAPGFDKEHWPDTNSHQFSNSGAYWGNFVGSNGGAVPY